MGNAGAAHDTDPIQLKIDANAGKEEKQWKMQYKYRHEQKDVQQ